MRAQRSSIAECNAEYAMADRGRARRKALCMTQVELAKRMGVAPAWLCRLERDGAATMTTIRAWAKALEMRASQLAFGEDE